MEVGDDILGSPQRVASPMAHSAGPGTTPRLRERAIPRHGNFEVTECANALSIRVKSQFNESFSAMRLLRQSGRLCDVALLTSDGDSVPAHKIVLAGASPYFKAMFTNGMVESEMRQIQLHGIVSETLGTLVDFCYTGQVEITQENVCKLLTAGSMLQLQQVVSSCCVFLEHQLDPTNCIGIADFAQQYGCVELHEAAHAYMNLHYREVTDSDEFQQLTAPQLAAILQRDELYASETDIFNSVFRWCNFDSGRRVHKLDSLLRLVRCHFLTPAFLQQQVQENETLVKCGVALDYVMAVCDDLTLHRLPGPVKPRSGLPFVIFTAGGYLRHSLDMFECLQTNNSNWTELPPLPMPKSGLGSCLVGNVFYAIGGRNNSPDGNVDSNTVHTFDLITNIWKECQSMIMSRNRVGVGVIDGLVYAVGGSLGSNHHNTVERFDPDTDQWQFVAPMSSRRIGAGVTVLNRYLFVVGGFDGYLRLNSVECYNPENDRWTFLASMNQTRSGAGVAALGGAIYAVGGYDSREQLRTVERYDIEADKWKFVCPMIFPRSALSIAVIGNRLYALGGYDGTEFLSSIEYYDPATDKWTIAGHMTCGRSGHGAAVGFLPPDK